NSPSTEYPHNIKVSPDGKYWYVVSTSGNSLQKYRTSDDSFVGEAFINSVSPYVNGNWNTATISNDGNTAYVVDWSATGDIAEVNTNTFVVTHNLGLFNNPHGSCMNPTGDTLYVTQNFVGSYQIYKIPTLDPDFSNTQTANLSPTAANLNTHEVLFSPDGSEYFVTCQGTNEVRVLKTGTDQLLATIPVGALPSEMGVSATHNLLFVTCEEDSTVAGQRGNVAVIDISSNTKIATIYTGYQPHGIAVDDAKNLVYVANRDRSTSGPAPHHSGNCGGRNGYMTFIDMNTLTLLQGSNGPKKVELSVDPYSVAVRH
ncbi:MAG: YncE family protein, partial [Bacteroidia bacterium]